MISISLLKCCWGGDPLHIKFFQTFLYSLMWQRTCKSNSHSHDLARRDYKSSWQQKHNRLSEWPIIRHFRKFQLVPSPFQIHCYKSHSPEHVMQFITKKKIKKKNVMQNQHFKIQKPQKLTTSSIKNSTNQEARAFSSESPPRALHIMPSIVGAKFK